MVTGPVAKNQKLCSKVGCVSPIYFKTNSNYLPNTLTEFDYINLTKETCILCCNLYISLFGS